MHTGMNASQMPICYEAADVDVMHVFLDTVVSLPSPVIVIKHTVDVCSAVQGGDFTNHNGEPVLPYRVSQSYHTG